MGFIVPGVAAGFVYETDSDLAALDGWVTNPEAPWATRKEALTLLEGRAVEFARELGFKRIVALALPSISRWLCNRHGFSPVGTSITCVKDL